MLVRLITLWTLCCFVVGNLFSQEIEHKHSALHSFIENKGQWVEPILFKSKFSGGNLWGATA